MNSSSHPLIRNLRQHGVLSDQDARTLLAAVGPTRTALSGEDIIAEGSQPTESTVLLDGIAARYKIGVLGSRQITAIHIPGDFVDLHSFALRRMDHGVVAVCDCSIAGVPHQRLLDMTAGSEALMRILWRSTLIDAAIHRTWLAQMSADAYCRTAHLLCELYVRHRIMGLATEQSFHFPLTQLDLGETLGMSTVHMNRTLRQLREEGLVTWQRGLVTIPNIEKLKTAANFDATYLNLVTSSDVDGTADPASVG